MIQIGTVSINTGTASTELFMSSAMTMASIVAFSAGSASEATRKINVTAKRGATTSKTTVTSANATIPKPKPLAIFAVRKASGHFRSTAAASETTAITIAPSVTSDEIQPSTG